MTIQERAIIKANNEYGLKEYDVINLNNANFYLKGKGSILKHNIAPTLTTNCCIAVVIKENEKC